ncbi:TetR/AcrR family transcriptional regulator [Moraxella oblonga]|uniref:TetR/AcrR family transcriptional regulator n=1 Tax=Moraxella oblonga TaxID=200413 RepID=UPI000AC8DE9F|nr:TetR/AcrR family transcriptional regulator [Moraxella oblonga]
MTQDLFDDTIPKKRKNNPELLRHSLILCAKDIMLRDGIANLSLQKVADMAGVSKGGLFHHFKNKDELMMSVFELFIAQVNTAIMAHMDNEFGAFTRAYVTVFFDNADIGLTSDWAGLIRSMTADSQMHALWANWLAQKLTVHTSTDDDIRLTVVRHAVDGAWLGEVKADDLPVMRDYLLGLIEAMDR